MIIKNNTIDTIYTHTEGEPTCIIYGGINYPANTTIHEKKEFLEKDSRQIRQSLLREPRGHNDMVGVFLTPPSSKEFDAGMIWADGERFMEMCGHGTIALSMVMVTHGMVNKINKPFTQIKFETLAGTVTSSVRYEDNIAKYTEFTNVPAFVYKKNIPVNLPNYGELKADIVWGGNFFAIVKWPDSNKKIKPENSALLSEMGNLVKEQINKKLKIVHPENKKINGLYFTTFWHEPDRQDSKYKNVHVFANGKLDRSPGGTGTSAMLAYFEDRGEITKGGKLKSEGLLSSGQFEGEILDIYNDKGIKYIIPKIKGTASILGYSKWILNEDDEVSKGFVI
jgi:proline racemase